VAQRPVFSPGARFLSRAAPEVVQVTREIDRDLVEEAAFGVTPAEPTAADGHVESGHNGEREALPLAPLALVGSANLGRLLADSDKRTLAILELRRRAAASKRSAGRPLLRPGVAVVGYVCVGGRERLANGEDYDAQAQAIEAFCRRRGLRLVRIVRDVDRAGGGAAPPPGLQHACQALADDEARALVVQELGRLTRSPPRLALLLRWLADAGRGLIAIDSGLDTSTAAGRQTAKALIEVGEWARQRDRRAQNGGHAGSGGRPAVRDLPELHARIAALREGGLTLRAIADDLNAEGVPTLRGGARWRPSSVQAAVGYKRPTARYTSGGLKLPSRPAAPADDGPDR
jgi:DNA invertase Pin-like site-specific DNA recombinase